MKTTTYKCSLCGHIVFHSRGERPGKCTQKKGWKAGQYLTCGGNLSKLAEIDGKRVTAQ